MFENYFSRKLYNFRGVVLFPYGKLVEKALKHTRCGVVFTPDGQTYQLLYQEPEPVGEVSKSVIHRRSIIREYENMILVSAYNGGYLELKLKKCVRKEYS